MKAEIEKVRRKFIALRSTLSERARRLWAGAEAESLGRGGIACVARATGMAISTVQKGRNEIRAGVDPAFVGDRKPGAGRHGKRRRRKRHEWIKLIVEQKQSGLSGRAFCKAHGIERGAFQDACQRFFGSKIRPERSHYD